MILPIWFIVYGLVFGVVLTALWYELRWKVRLVLWFLVSANLFFAVGWKLYEYYHPEVLQWPFA